MAYPSSAKSFTTKNAGDTIQPADVNDLQTEVAAIEADLLTPLPQARGGTGKDTSGATDGQVLIGKTSDHTLNLATLTAGSGISVTNGGGSISIAATGANQITLLKANSGTDTNAGATSVDTYAMASGLTAKDTLLIRYTIETVTQATANTILQNSTDTVTAISMSNGNALTAGDIISGTVWISDAQSATTTVLANNVAGVTTNTTEGNGFNTVKRTTFTTAWTGAWTLALKHGGVTGGGTFKWSWAVFKIAGQ